jgi:predicted MFS family arabinose efflux permease
MLITQVGLWMQRFGQGYFVVQLAIRDGRPHLAPLYLGLVGLAQAIPSLCLGLLGGAVADRMDRRRLILVTQCVMGLIAALFAILVIADRIDILTVLLLSAITSALHSFDAPARQSLFPNLVPRQHLVSAVGLNSTAMNAAQFIGPTLGGILYVPLGIGGLFALNAVSYLALVGALLRMRFSRPARPAPTEGVLASIREGLGYIRQDAVLRWIIVLALASQFLVRPYIHLMPAFAEQTLHVDALGLAWLMGASGAGAFIGTLLGASLGGVERRGRVLFASAVVAGALMIAFASQRALVAALVTLAVLSVCVLLFQQMVMSTLQIRTPDHMRGRIMSVHGILPLAFMPFGIMVLGSLGTFVGVDVALAIGGLGLAALAALLAIRSRELRDARIHPRVSPVVSATADRAAQSAAK